MKSGGWIVPCLWVIVWCPLQKAEAVRTGGTPVTPFATRLVEVGTGYSRTSVNTAVFRSNSLVTNGNEQYTGYYDAEGYLTLAKRELDKAAWEVYRASYRGHVEDAHNVISLMVDGDNYLHIAFDHHGDTLHYCRGTAPGSLVPGSQEEMTGIDETDVTYPEFYRLADGGLLFVYRSGASGRGNLIMNRYDLQTRRWSRVQEVLIDGEGERSAYWQMCVDDRGVIHLSWVWRGTWMVETNHDLCYARSYDNGVTWCRTDGTGYDLPIRRDNAEYACRIPQNSGLINQTGMDTDSLGNPYVATYWCDPGSDVPQYRLVWHDGREWHARRVSDRTVPFSLKGGGTKMLPLSRPRIVVEGGGAVLLFRDMERGGRVSAAYTEDLTGGKWEVADLTDFPVGAWEPTFDTELWKRRKKLHLFVQQTGQGDGERTIAWEAQPVYVLEINQSPVHE